MSMSVDKRSDGTRYNWLNLGSKFASCEVIIYLRHSCGNINDEVSGKMGGGRHSGGSSPKCYDMGIDTEDGSTRLRYEDHHPDYEDGPTGAGNGQGGGIGLHGSWVGYCFVKRNMSNGVLLEIWQDQGNNAGSAPANQWRCIASWLDTKKNWRNPPSDHQETIRVDNVNCLEYKWPAIREISPSDSSTPGTGGVGGGIGGGTGSGTIGGGTIGGGTIGGGTIGGGTIGGGIGGIGGSTGGGISSGDGTGNTGTGIDTPDPQESSVLYERKEFWIRYNIRHISDDACSVGKDPATLPLTPIYSVSGDVYVEFKNYKRCGIQVATEDKTNPAKTSMFIGKPPIRYLKLTMRKAILNDNLTGNITVCIRDKDYNVVNTLTTIAITSLNANDQDFPLNFPTNLRDLKLGDMLSIEYDGSTQTDYLRVKVSQTEKIDGSNTRLFVFDGNSYIFDNYADLAADISV